MRKPYSLSVARTTCKRARPGAGWKSWSASWLSARRNDNPYNVVGSAGLAGSGIGSLPSDRDGVATVEDTQSIERNLRLRALGVHKVLPTGEGDAVDLNWSLVASVTDDVDGGCVVFKVWGQGVESERLRVVLDELAEDLGALRSLLVGYATASAVVTTIVLAWGRGADFPHGQVLGSVGV